MKRLGIWAVLLIAGCQDDMPEEQWPTSWREGGDPVVDAWQVWLLGADYFPDPPDDESESRDIFERPGLPRGWYGAFAMNCKDFIRRPELQPAVQFSCFVRMTPFESSLEDSMEKGDFHERLQAVTLLMKVRAPSSVPEQWKTLQELSATARGSALSLVEELKGEFRLEKLLPQLSHPPPSNDVSNPEFPHTWAIRAAGVARIEAALPRLKSLSRMENIDITLAAERSLEDLQGPEADEALVHCLQGWRYNAAGKAGRALLARDKTRLKEGLLAGAPPDRYRYLQGCLLAACDAPEAVPILCTTVPEIGVIDREMFQEIGRLAMAEHESLVLALPGTVREEQREMAEGAVADYFRRVRQ